MIASEKKLCASGPSMRNEPSFRLLVFAVLKKPPWRGKDVSYDRRGSILTSYDGQPIHMDRTRENIEGLVQ